MDDFAKTRLGRKLLEADIPRLVAALEKVAEEMILANNLKMLELGVEPSERAQFAVRKTRSSDVPKGNTD